MTPIEQALNASALMATTGRSNTFDANDLSAIFKRKKPQKSFHKKKG